jgi:glutamyl-tRNA synthetase
VTVRVRIAPSPTGDPHVGTAYMALFDLAFARQQGGQFILRIEDTDRTRYVPQSEQLIYDTLRWLGLDWDEGPDKGGPYGPYRQSERLPLYRQAAEELIARGAAYYCWCSPARLDELRKEQQRQKLPPRYDRLCYGKTRAERAALPGFTERAVVRMLVPDEGTTVFDDLIRGPIAFENRLLDDQVLLKSDGFPTYHLAVVVDDHYMRITHVTRGEEWISSTPKHLLLYQAFGWEPPRFGHLPLLRNPDRSKISKRKNPAARLTWFREEGFLPAALLNFLALLGFSLPDDREIFTFDDLVQHFAWDRFSTTGPIFDLDKLEWLNGYYIRQLTPAELARQVQPFMARAGVDASVDDLVPLMPLVQERLKRLAEAPELLDFFFRDDVTYERTTLVPKGLDEASAREALGALAELVRSTEPYHVETLEARARELAAQRGWKTGALFMAARVALTGRTVSPPLFETMVALGRERTVARLERARAMLAGARR